MDTTLATSEFPHPAALQGAPLGEAELVRAALADPLAFAELYRLHHREVWRYLRHRTGDSHAADDLLGEVFLEFLRGLAGFRPRGIGVRGWLYRVATRRVARWSKRRQREEPLDGTQHARASETAAGSEQGASVRAALAALPERLQVVLVLHHLEGLSVEEIARTLGKLEGTIKSRLARGREELRRRLQRQGDER